MERPTAPAHVRQRHKLSIRRGRLGRCFIFMAGFAEHFEGIALKWRRGTGHLPSALPGCSRYAVCAHDGIYRTGIR